MSDEIWRRNFIQFGMLLIRWARVKALHDAFGRWSRPLASGSREIPSRGWLIATSERD